MAVDVGERNTSVLSFGGEGDASFIFGNDDNHYLPGGADDDAFAFAGSSPQADRPAAGAR
ncbi:MAG: hypothetical protein RIC87_18575 [Kiloniellales bacterium]